MKKLLITLTACLSFSLQAAEAGLTLPNDDLPALEGDALIISQQSGMQVYVNNCLGCHSLEFQRYNRTAKDLQIPEDVMKENLIFTDAKIGDLMKNNMSPELAANWFGTAPPDLSVVARARGTHWLYNYLRAFYVDSARPYGTNNSVFTDVGMPHAMERLQGLQAKSDAVVALEGQINEAKATIASASIAMEQQDASDLEQKISDAEKAIVDAEAELVSLSKAGKYFSIVKAGELTPEEFDHATADLVNFLDYIGEPIKQERKRLGVWVLAFILFFGFVSYLLKKEYWKDVH